MILTPMPDGKTVRSYYPDSARDSVLSGAAAGTVFQSASFVPNPDFRLSSPMPADAVCLNPPASLLDYAKSRRDGISETGLVKVEGLAITVSTHMQSLTTLSSYKVLADNDPNFSIVSFTSSRGDQAMNATQITAAAEAVTLFRKAVFDTYAATKAAMQSVPPTVSTKADVDARFASYGV